MPPSCDWLQPIISSISNVNFWIVSAAWVAIGVNAVIAWKAVRPPKKPDPNLEISVVSEDGDIVSKEGHPIERFWHLKIKNTVKNSVAENTSIYCIGYQVKKENGTFDSLETFPHLRFLWPYECDDRIDRLRPTKNIRSQRRCDLCSINQNSKQLELRSEFKPTPLNIALYNKRPLKLYFIAEADNFESPLSAIVLIDWDGEWVDGQMDKKIRVTFEGNVEPKFD